MMQASLELLKPDDKPIGTIEKKILEEMLQLMVNNNILKNSINLDELYTTKFLD